MNVGEAGERVLDEALRQGASDAEVVAVDGRQLDVRVRLGEVEYLERSAERRLALRVFHGQSSSVCSTADLTPTGLDRVVEDAITLARGAAPDPFGGLATPEGPPFPDTELDLYDPDVAALEADQALEMARRAETAALGFDRRITNSEGSSVMAGTVRQWLFTSQGFAGSYESSAVALSVVPVASDEAGMQRDHWESEARHWTDLDDPEQVGEIAARRTVRRLGARGIRTCRVPVVFEPSTARTLLAHLASAVTGPSLYRSLSFLRDRLGEPIAPPGVSIIDDATLPRGLASRPFDAEGLPSRRNRIVHDGVLENYLLDTYSGRKLEMRSTANAVRALGDSPGAGPSNLSLEPGTRSPEEILRDVREGFWVTELFGFGVNGVTGDYSRGAAGLWIENGETAFPVQEVTIAGNLLDMFASIDAIGNDVDRREPLVAPTIRIPQMTVAGSG